MRPHLRLLARPEPGAIVAATAALCLATGCGSGLDCQDSMAIVEVDSGYLIVLNDAEMATFSAPELSGAGAPVVEIEDATGGWRYVSMNWELAHATAQDELSIQFDLMFEPDFWWAPHLAPEDGYVVGQHVFRAPALIVQERSAALALVPDLDLVGHRQEKPWFLDFDATRNSIVQGMAHTEIPEHVLFHKKPGMRFAPGRVELGFYVISADWYHILDASLTALLMLRWHEELERDERLIAYARTYADRLLTLQDSDGFFPGWLHPDTHQPGPVMNQTPETSMSVTFLLKLAELSGGRDYRDAALSAMDVVLEEIVPSGRWEDFETYWSCCTWGRDTYLGSKIERNDMFKQYTLSMFWTAEALLESYRVTGEATYLDWGGARSTNSLWRSRCGSPRSYTYHPWVDLA